MSGERQKQSLQEIAAKEEELVVLRVEASALQEKLKSRTDEVTDEITVRRIVFVNVLLSVGAVEI